MLKHVQAGQAFEPSASRTNVFVDVALWFKGRQARNGLGDGFSTPDNFLAVEIENKTGAAVDQWGILKLGDLKITHTEDADKFKESLIFEGLTPTEGVFDLHVFTTQQLEVDEIGLALFVGVAPVQIDIVDEAHKYARTVAGDSEKLISVSSGPYQILFKEPGTGVKWCKAWIPQTPPQILTVKTTTGMTPGGVAASMDVWDSSQDSGEDVSGVFAWTAPAETLDAETEGFVARVPGWDDWVLFAWDCDGLQAPSGGPLGDPPTAVGTFTIT